MFEFHLLAFSFLQQVYVWVYHPWYFSHADVSHSAVLCPLDAAEQDEDGIGSSGNSDDSMTYRTVPSRLNDMQDTDIQDEDIPF